jgi:tRNA threonylcarbamoyladenosine biosynthesis protein TsaE
MRKFLVESEDSMLALGGRLGTLMRQHPKDQILVLLEGAVGAGKSCFARGCIRAALGKPDLIVSSPTFVLLNSYFGDGVVVHHVDLYRVHTAAELPILDLPSLHADHMLVEWPGVAKSSFESWGKLFVKIEMALDESRDVTILGPENWTSRI